MADMQCREPVGESDDPFAEDYGRIAAYARQMMRAHRANDSEALELEYLHFDHYLCNSLLWRHMKRQDKIWDNGERWFDGLSARPEFPSPGRLRLRGEIAWVVGQEKWYYDPLDFELELCPTAGAFRGYIIRFGDHRPLAQKTLGSAKRGVPAGPWAFVFEQRRESPDVLNREYDNESKRV
jgi:hypothetical protein